MQADDWHKAWHEGRIGFHQSRVNSRLERHWPALGLAPGAPVLVPLSGKSLDLHWLHEQGHAVLGSELSEIAVRDFFTEQGMAMACEALPLTGASDTGPMQRYWAVDTIPPLEMLVGDFFALSPRHSAHCTSFYDRAALIAMPPEQQPAYLTHLASLLPTGSTGLLITLSYDTSQMQGPPFSTPDDRVRTMAEPYFELELLEHSRGAERLGNLKERGLDSMDENVYRLQRRLLAPTV